jgi:hypothetical protein
LYNTRSIETVDQALLPGGWRRPCYEHYSFYRIPGTIEHLLCGAPHAATLPVDTLPDESFDDVDRVVLLFIDGFAWRYVEMYADQYPVLARFIEQGTMSKLTSMFPSTTTNHVTGIHTGLAPAQSGLFEWFQYHEAFDGIIAPLLFTRAGEHKRDGLLKTGIDPAVLFPGETMHERLRAAGVESIYVTPAAFTPSPYNDQVCRGAVGAPYKTLKAGLDYLSARIAAPTKGREYLHFYFGDVDAASHHHGLHSPKMENAVRSILDPLERWFADLAPARKNRTLVMFTADHGMTETHADATVYLNKVWPEIGSMLSSTRHGLMIPAGSPRDFFLYVQPDALTHVADELTQRLAGVADVALTKDFIEAGHFGPGEPSAEFVKRVGDLVILPHAGESVWWYERDRFANEHCALHGGLSIEEMDIPFGVLRV